MGRLYSEERALESVEPCSLRAPFDDRTRRVPTTPSTSSEPRDAQWLGQFFTAHGFTAQRTHPSIAVFPNGLQVDGDLVLGDGSGAHVVEGDVSVTGNIVLADLGGLWVTGRVRCESFVLGEFDAQLGGGLVAASSVVLRAHRAEQRVEPIHSPVIIRHSADGQPAPLSLVSKSLVREGLLPQSMTQSFLSALKARRASVLQSLRAGDSFDAMLNLKKTVSGLVSPRVASLLDAVRSGAEYEWATFNGSAALRVSRSDGSKQLAILSPAEATVLREKLATPPST